MSFLKQKFGKVVGQHGEFEFGKLGSGGLPRAWLENERESAADSSGTGMTEKPKRSDVCLRCVSAPLRHSAFRRIWLASLPLEPRVC